MLPAEAIAIRPSAAGWLYLLIVLGVVIAGVVALHETLRTSWKCDGAFSSGFSADYDVHHCELIIRFVKIGTQIMMPLSWPQPLRGLQL
jgi:hypothetical protein